jgi:hypothetical protein
MGDVRITLWVGVCLVTLVGCATRSVGEVQEVGQGTYSIGVGRSLTLVSGAEDMKEAVTKAGAYCHSKGQKAPATRGWDRGFCSPGELVRVRLLER